MKRLSIALLFAISFMVVNAMTLKQAIVWRVIYTWDVSIKSLDIIPVEASFEKNVLTLHVVQEEPEVITIKVKDSLGNIIFQDEVNCTEEDSYKFDMNGCSKGVYQVVVSSKYMIVEGDFCL